MATDIRALRKAIGQWAFNVVDANSNTREVVLANSGQAAQLRVPNIVTMLSEDKKLGFPDTKLSEDGLTYTVTHTSQIRVQLEVYGGDKDNSAMQDASLLMNSLYDPARYLDLWLICGLMNIETIQDLTALETGVMKQRAQCVFHIIAELSDAFVSDSFDTIETDVIRAIPEETIVTLVINADD